MAEDRHPTLQYLKITALAAALGGLGNGMHAIILPILVQELVAPDRKSTYLGVLTFMGLIIAIVMQPIAGTASDHSSFRWGRRRPYVFLGIATVIVLLGAIGLSSNYSALLAFWCLTQVSLNIAQGPYQALMVDVVPEGRRGTASGVKAFLEVLGAVALLRILGYSMGKYESQGGDFWLWFSLGALALALAATLAVTILFVKERRAETVNAEIHASLFLRSFKIDIRANPRFVLFLTSRLLFIMALSIVQTYGLYFFQDVVGIANPAQITADLITAVGIAMLVVVYPAGRLSDRFGRQLFLAASGFVAAAGVAVIFFFHAYYMVLVGGVLIGIATGVFLSTNWALATDLVPAAEAARYLGLANMASAGGAAVARLIGPAIDFFNQYGQGMGYSVVLGVCFAFFVLAALLHLFMQVKYRGT